MQLTIRIFICTILMSAVASQAKSELPYKVRENQSVPTAADLKEDRINYLENKIELFYEDDDSDAKDELKRLAPARYEKLMKLLAK